MNDFYCFTFTGGKYWLAPFVIAQDILEEGVHFRVLLSRSQYLTGGCHTDVETRGPNFCESFCIFLTNFSPSFVIADRVLTVYLVTVAMFTGMPLAACI